MKTNCQVHGSFCGVCSLPFSERIEALEKELENQCFHHSVRIEVLERALRQLIVSGNRLRKYYAFAPDTNSFLVFEKVLESVKKVLG